jgi:hypothetical protein
LFAGRQSTKTELKCPLNHEIASGSESKAARRGLHFIGPCGGTRTE